MKKDTTELFATAPIPKAVLKNIIPTIISMLMIMIYNLADTFFIGHTPADEKEVALMVTAVSVASPAFFLFMMVGNLFGVGGTSLISRSLGAGKGEKAKHISAFCFWTEVAIGVLGTVIIHFFAKPICYMIGANDDIIHYAVEYLDIISFSIPFLVIGNTFSNIIRAEGRPRTAMIGSVAGNVINIVLDPLFINVFKLDVRGAAIATVIGNVFAAAFYIAHLVSKNSILSIKPSMYKVNDKIATGVMAIGIPAAINSLLMTISNIVMNSLMIKYDTLAAGGLGVAAKVNSIVVMVLLGMGIGIQPLLGYNYGAKNKERFKGIMKFSLILAFGISCVMTVICYSLAGPLVNAFLKDKAAFDYGFQFCRIYIYAGPVLGFMFVFQNAVQASGAAIPATILSLCRQGIILIPCYFIADAIFHTPVALTMCVPIADYLSTMVGAILFIYVYRRAFKNMDTNDIDTSKAKEV